MPYVWSCHLAFTAQPLHLFACGHKLLLYKSVQPMCLDVVGAAQGLIVPGKRPRISVGLQATQVSPVLQAWGAHLVHHCAMSDSPVKHLITCLNCNLHIRIIFLAGMGCSAGVIAIGLAQKLLATQPKSYALVVSLETVTQNW